MGYFDAEYNLFSEFYHGVQGKREDATWPTFQDGYEEVAIVEAIIKSSVKKMDSDHLIIKAFLVGFVWISVQDGIQTSQGPEVQKHSSVLAIASMRQEIVDKHKHVLFTEKERCCDECYAPGKSIRYEQSR